jgi:hypothetical protein
MYELAYLPILLLVFAAPLAVGYWLLRPLHLRSRDRSVAVRRFMLIDYVAFAIELQVFLAVAMFVLRDGASGVVNLWGGFASVLLLDLILLVAAALITLAGWWGAVEASARAKIADWRRRLVIHIVFLPGVFGSMLLTGMSVFAIGEQLIGSGSSWWSDAFYGGWYTLGTIAATAVAVGAMRLVSAWICQEALPTTDESSKSQLPSSKI